MTGFKKGRTRCTVINKQNKKRCKAYADYNQTICRAHLDPNHGNPNMGDVGRRFNKGNNHAMKLGTYSKKLLTQREREIYEEVEKFFNDKYNFEDPASLILLDQLCWSTAKLFMARLVGDDKALRDYEKRVTKRMSELNIRPDRDRQQKSINPQDLIMALLKRGKGDELEAGAQSKRLQPPGTNTLVIEGEVADEVIGDHPANRANVKEK